jgi:uncharacterized protein YecE (DUF72 family)
MLANVPRLIARIAAFVAALPRDPLYAIEVRDPELVSADFARALATAGAVPCLALHARMPSVDLQAGTLGVNTSAAGPLVVRWNLHAGRSYDDAKADYFPFNRIIEEDLPSRTALARLARTTAAAGRDVFITINNKAEGSAPLSVEHLAKAITAGE